MIDPTAKDVVSGIDLADDERFGIRWPPGFSLVLDRTEAAVLDSDGKVVARNGEVIGNAGGAVGDPATICIIDGTQYPLT